MYERRTQSEGVRDVCVHMICNNKLSFGFLLGLLLTRRRWIDTIMIVTQLKHAVCIEFNVIKTITQLYSKHTQVTFLKFRAMQ